MTSVDLPDLTDIREGLSLRRQARIVAGEWVRRHAVSACLLIPLLVLVGAVHAIGMWSFPRWVDDPGTYLSQAWSFQYRHALSPYSYIYDHAPAGWIQLSLWSMLTNGFNRHASAIGFGNECMLIAKLASCALLFALGRRLQFSRPGAAGAVLLFGLCPLELMYSRWTFLDNLVTPWLLLAFLLAASPRRSISAATGASLSFAMAALTKETALVMLPALVWAMAQNLDRRNRPQVITVAGFSGLLLMAMYPLYALYKGELLERPGQNSLLGTANGSWPSASPAARSSTRPAPPPTWSASGSAPTGGSCWPAWPPSPSPSWPAGSGRRSSPWSSSGWSWSAAATCRSCMS
jgi:hypothetical protein